MKLQIHLLNDNTLQDSSETLVIHQVNNIENCGKTVIRNNKQLSNCAKNCLRVLSDVTCTSCWSFLTQVQQHYPLYKLPCNPSSF